MSNLMDTLVQYVQSFALLRMLGITTKVDIIKTAEIDLFINTHTSA